MCYALRYGTGDFRKQKELIVRVEGQKDTHKHTPSPHNL